MTLMVCCACSTKCAVGLDACPHCKSTDLKEDGTMPKITVHGGPSYAEDIPSPDEGEAGGTDIEVTSTDGSSPPATSETETDVPPATTEDEAAVVEADDAGDEPADENPAEGDDDDNEVDPDAEPAAATTPRPATNASKAEWLTYARAITGEDIEDGDYTKTELQDLTKSYEA